MSSPKIQCQQVHEAWFGYGDPEVHECTSPATHRGWVADPWEGGRHRVLLCADCAEDARQPKGQTQALTTYRFRTVAK